jgi:UDP-N-acetylmuramoyl-L-alanyl-D-glutamate--2,6-diaminopimelate ligase
MRQAGVKYLVLEVSSHALAQHRVLGVPFEIAVMTNVTHEHLDFHRTMARYAEAKMRLFRRARFGVVNAEDKYAAQFIKAAGGKVSTYGLRKGDFTPKNMPVQSQLPGEYNVANALAAAAVGRRLGLKQEQILAGIASLATVPGRMSTVNVGQKWTAIIDYAHTPDAMERVLTEGRRLARRNRLIAVFGAQGGHRDPTKRRPMGEIAGRLADMVVLTEDESYETSVAEIMAMIAEGAQAAGKQEGRDLFMEPRREKATALAVKLARPGDVVMFLGKGHEKTINRAGGEEVYDEFAEVEKAIRRDSKAG